MSILKGIQIRMGKLNLRELINFYDYKVDSSNTHASAINAVIGEDFAVALLSHYFKSIGKEVEVLNSPCTQGTQRGVRLDKWIVVKSQAKSLIYQVEIKNWSAHSIGGKTVKPGSDENYMREYRIKRWLFQFNIDNKVPSQKETLKVLTKMRVPSSHSSCSQRTLLCFWEALHPKGEADPFFEVKVNCEAFKQMSVFSMSNYVSNLLRRGTKSIEVTLADADKRIAWLKTLYG